MTEQRPDTDERDDPSGTPSPSADSLTAKSATPGGTDPGDASAVPGAYEADEAAQVRGKAVKPGN